MDKLSLESKTKLQGLDLTPSEVILGSKLIILKHGAFTPEETLEIYYIRLILQMRKLLKLGLGRARGGKGGDLQIERQISTKVRLWSPKRFL